MLKFYYSAAPNPTKIALFLEEAGLPYKIFPINIGKGEQFQAHFLKVSPNNRIPAILDHEPKGGGAPISVFETGAILFYLGEKTGKFLPTEPHKRYDVMQWLFWQMGGLGPMAGQNNHFRNYAPEKLPYAINRYAFEAQRHFGILNDRLAKRKYMLGDVYTIVDMAVWGWARLAPNVLGEDAWAKFSNLKRLVDEISARPAAQRAAALKEKHQFKTEMDEVAVAAMFPHMQQKVA